MKGMLLLHLHWLIDGEKAYAEMPLTPGLLLEWSNSESEIEKLVCLFYSLEYRVTDLVLTVSQDKRISDFPRKIDRFQFLAELKSLIDKYHQTKINWFYYYPELN